MATFTSFSDYKLPDGRIDWDSYRAAQVANGENCFRCGEMTSVSGARGQKSLCTACKRMDAGEARHPKFIKCPSCGHTCDAMEWYSVFKEGEHDVNCPTCNYLFEVETRVTYEFVSKERSRR